MKTNEVSSKKDWTLIRVLRVSTKFALLYTLISIIFVLIFGSKSEIVLDLGFKMITLPINFWVAISINIIAIQLVGILIFGTFKLSEKKKLGDVLYKKEGDSRLARTINLIYDFGFILFFSGMMIGFCFVGVEAGLGIELLLGIALLFGAILGFINLILCTLIGILIWLIKFPLSEEFWKAIAKGILFGWKWLIR